jgi:hypothetical protein
MLGDTGLKGFNFNSPNVGKHRIELKSIVRRHWTELFQGKVQMPVDFHHELDPLARSYLELIFER